MSHDCLPTGTGSVHMLNFSKYSMNNLCDYSNLLLSKSIYRFQNDVGLAMFGYMNG